MNDSCGCCETAVSPTPALVTNRPGLSALVYRIGDFAQFRQAMVEAIAQAEVEADGVLLRPLQSWTARQSDDYGIALLEMWAYLGDILSFLPGTDCQRSVFKHGRFAGKCAATGCSIGLRTGQRRGGQCPSRVHPAKGQKRLYYPRHEGAKRAWSGRKTAKIRDHGVHNGPGIAEPIPHLPAAHHGKPAGSGQQPGHAGPMLS